MAKLPFLVEPRNKPIIEILGTEESGKIEIERKGYLSVGERSFVASALSGNDSSAQLIKLCREIAADEKVNLDYSYQLVTDMMQGQNLGDYDPKLVKRVEKKHQVEMSDILTKMMQAESRREMLQAMAMLIYRVDATIEIGDVMSTHPDLIKALSELYRDEETRSVDRLKEVNDKQEGNASPEEVATELEKK